MQAIFRGVLVACALAFVAAPGVAAEKPASHHIAIQVSQNDPERMNLALLNTANAIKYYSGKGETIEVEVVAYGPGLNMLREDTSPVKDRIKSLKASEIGGKSAFPPATIRKRQWRSARAIRSRSSPRPQSCRRASFD